MDILTQGLLGGVLAQSVAKKEETKLATLIGFFAGLIADADIFIYSSSDPMLNIEFHRHFTHSLIFIPVGAAIAMALLWPFLRHRLPIKRLYLYSLMGYSLSGVLDACTSYGTHLLWPFSDERIAFNIISIIDPLFTLMLLITLIVSYRVKLQKVAHIGLAIAVSYMLFGFIQQQRAMTTAEELIVLRGHQTNHQQSHKHVVKPTMGNLLLWRSVYIYKDRIYADAIRVGIFSENTIYEGESTEKVSIQKHFPKLSSLSVLYKDIQRFETFSDGYVAFDLSDPNVVGDLRYSMLPTKVKPLWGIVINRDNPEKHAGYQFFRDGSEPIRTQFIKMLLGK